MKKTINFLFFASLLGLISSCNNGTNSAAANFQGIIHYEIKTGAGMPPEAATMLQSADMKTYVKGTLSRGEESVAGNKTIILCDSKNPDDPTILMAMMGRKYAVKRNDSLKKVAASNVPSITYIDSASATKQIAGYACKKAKITLVFPDESNKSDTVTSFVYYTTDLPYADPEGQFKGLKGMPMEFSINMGGLNLTIAAKSVEKVNVADSLFTIPAGYKIIDLTDLRKELASSMQADTTGTK